MILRPVYSKFGIIAWVRFNRAADWKIDDKGDQRLRLECQENIHNQIKTESIVFAYV